MIVNIVASEELKRIWKNRLYMENHILVECQNINIKENAEKIIFVNTRIIAGPEALKIAVEQLDNGTLQLDRKDIEQYEELPPCPQCGSYSFEIHYRKTYHVNMSRNPFPEHGSETLCEINPVTCKMCGANLPTADALKIADAAIWRK